MTAGNGKHRLSKAQLAALARGRRIGARLGGLAVKDKRPPDVCPDCGREIALAGYTWHRWLGHRGLHGLADRYFAGDLAAAQRRLRENGLARQDPAPENGAFRSYAPIAETLMAE
jgi:hypothetical protein